MGLLNMGKDNIPPSGIRIKKEVEFGKMNKSEKRSTYNKILTDVWGYSTEDIESNVESGVSLDIIDKDLGIYRDIHDIDRKQYLENNKTMDGYKVISNDNIRKEWLKRIQK